MKTIIAVWHSSGKGKSQTIKELASLITSKHQHTPLIPVSIPESGDIRVVIRVNGQVICLESQGDPDTLLENRLNDIINLYNPDTIICSTRTRGETVDAVNRTASLFAYNVIWTSTYQSSHSSQFNMLNKLKAKHIHDLLINLSII